MGLWRNGVGRAREAESLGTGGCWGPDSLTPWLIKPQKQTAVWRGWLGLGRQACSMSRLSPKGLAVPIAVLEAHFLQLAAPVELIVPTVSLLAEVLHVHPDQHLPQLHEVAVILILHCRQRAHGPSDRHTGGHGRTGHRTAARGLAAHSKGRRQQRATGMMRGSG